ncbi:hypothetical protein BH18ACT5_BH18ACT5_17430 [soil metagenome]
MEDLLHVPATCGMPAQTLIGELLKKLEVLIAFVASVLVSRHGSKIL